MALGDTIQFVGYKSGDTPQAGDVFFWKTDGEEGPPLDPYFEVTSFVDDFPATIVAEQLSEGELPITGVNIDSDDEDAGGYGGSAGDWVMELAEDAEVIGGGGYVDLAGTVAGAGAISASMTQELTVDLAAAVAGAGAAVGSLIPLTGMSSYSGKKRIVCAGNNQVWYGVL